MTQPPSRFAGPARLDVISLGRSSVDLYGEQVGGPLEDMQSFAKYVGGCPTNIAVGTARLGLKSALITRVGDEHMGRFIRQELAREGVDVSQVRTDPERLTALVILGIRSKSAFPLIFYRENCADSAMDESDIDASVIADARALVVTGTHFSRPNLDRASRAAMAAAKAAGRVVVLDIDYRPVLWGVTGHGMGEERFVDNAAVTGHLQSIVSGCDVIVGTEEEFHIAGGSTDTVAALRAVRALAPAALLVCKRGPMGCVLFDGAVPDSLDDGIRGPGFPVEVYNVLGAGDAFMSGFLRGYLRDLPLTDCARLANACGAFAVSRHGCAPAIPSWTELDFFLSEGSAHTRLREDPALDQLHWSTTRKGAWPRIHALAFDHRSQLEELVARHNQPAEKIGAFKGLVLEAWHRVRTALGGTTCGVLIDGRYGQDLLDSITDDSVWIGRPVEKPGSLPLRFDGYEDLGSTLREWPRHHVVKCLFFYHPDDPAPLLADHQRHMQMLKEATRRTGHELLLEIIPTRSGLPVDATTLPRALEQIYALGIHPDWWKLPPPGSQGEWQALAGIIARNDPHCRGIVLLGLDAPEAEMLASFDLAARQPVCKGFAVGRTIFGEAADLWLSGKISDEAAVSRMAGIYRRLIDHYEQAAA
jgi:5-dehydro-2-deoxygluconokinase